MSTIATQMRWYFAQRGMAVPPITSGYKAVEEAIELVEAIRSEDLEGVMREVADVVIVAAVVAAQYGFTIEAAIAAKGWADQGRGAPALERV